MIRQILVIASTFLIFFILLFAYTKLVGPIPFQVNSVNTTKSTTFDVTGEGKASIRPDSANISAGVSASGTSVKEVQDQVNSIISKVSASIKALGIDAKDIQTSNYNVNPTYDYTSGNQKITGYSANTSLTIKVRNVADAGKVIDAATANGATNVTNLGFDSSDKSGAENEARKLAVADAKKKAENAAQIAGFRLGNLVNYNEGFSGQPRPVMMKATGGGVGGAPETTLEPGSNEVTVSVTLSYEIK